MLKKASVESPSKNSSKKWTNAEGKRIAAPRSPKVEDRQKPKEISTTQKTIEDLQKNISEEPLSINLPSSPEPGMR